MTCRQPKQTALLSCLRPHHSLPAYGHTTADPATTSFAPNAPNAIHIVQYLTSDSPLPPNTKLNPKTRSVTTYFFRTSSRPTAANIVLGERGARKTEVKFCTVLFASDTLWAPKAQTVAVGACCVRRGRRSTAPQNPVRRACLRAVAWQQRLQTSAGHARLFSEQTPRGRQCGDW